jgi:translation initiation factor IF-1
MARGEPVEADGVVTELLPHALFRVRLVSGHLVVAHAAGGWEKNFVRLVTGDRVRVRLSPHDLGRGRITRRLEDDGRTGA